MDHYVPKRRIPVTLWSEHLGSVSGLVFLDLDPSGQRHQTILERLNEASPFLPVGVGDEARVRLLHRSAIVRVTPAARVLAADVYARGFQPWREERADLVLRDGAHLSGRVWMPLERETQRLSDYMNQQASAFLVLLTQTGIHLVNSAAVVAVELDESAGAPLGLDRVPHGIHDTTH